MGTIATGAPSTLETAGAASTIPPASSVETSRNAGAARPLDELAARIETEMIDARRAGRYEDAARLARALAALLEAPAGAQDAPAPSTSAPVSKVKPTRKRRA